MPKAGYCDVCGTFVWIDEHGACQQGHDPAHIKDVYDAQPTASRGRRTLVVAAVATTALIVACGVGGVIASGVMVSRSVARLEEQEAQRAKLESAEIFRLEREACWASQAAIDLALQDWAKNPVGPREIPEGSGWTYLSDTLGLEGIGCPDGVVLQVEDGKIAPCPIHGSYSAPEAAGD